MTALWKTFQTSGIHGYRIPSHPFVVVRFLMAPKTPQSD